MNLKRFISIYIVFFSSITFGAVDVFYEYAQSFSNEGIYGNSLVSHKLGIGGLYSKFFITRNLGMRLEYVPKKTVTNSSDLKSSISGSKLYLTFDLEPKKMKLFGFRFTPFVSVWNHSAEYPRYDDLLGSWSNEDLKLKNEKTVGGEVKVSLDLPGPFELGAVADYEKNLDKTTVALTNTSYGMHLAFLFGKTNRFISVGARRDVLAVSVKSYTSDPYIKKLDNTQNSFSCGLGTEW